MNRNETISDVQKRIDEEEFLDKRYRQRVEDMNEPEYAAALDKQVWLYQVGAMAFFRALQRPGVPSDAIFAPGVN